MQLMQCLQARIYKYFSVNVRGFKVYDVCMYTTWDAMHKHVFWGSTFHYTRCIILLSRTTALTINRFRFIRCKNRTL